MSIGAGLKRTLIPTITEWAHFQVRVLGTARKFKDLGATRGEEVEVLQPIDKSVRALRFNEGGLFPDLLAEETEALEDDSCRSEREEYGW